MGKLLWTMLLIIFLTVTAVNIVSAKEGKNDDLSKVIESIAIPESPAFSVLGITPDKVVRPGNGRELALALINGVNENGNFQNGVALDFSPYLLLFGDNLTLAEYREHSFAQFASHVQLSFGTSKGQDDKDKSERVAAGLRATIFDSGDPRMDTKFDDCVKAAHDTVLNMGPIPPGAIVEEIADKIKERERILEQKVKQCRDKHAEESIGKPALDIGLSPLWISEDGQNKNLKSSGIAAWSSFKAGYKRLLMIANVQYKSKDSQPAPAPTGGLLQGRSISGGLKARIGSAASAFLAQGVYTSFTPEGKQKDEYYLYSIGGEVKLANNLWLEVSVGGTSGKEVSNSSFVSSQLKWGISETSTLQK